jgi:23S rRNA (cytosine1962-C5)-methyltransferase
MADEKSILLKRGVARRTERGHLWVFSNEVDSLSGDPQPGDAVKVFSAKRKFLGMALYSKSSMIRARIYSRIWEQDCDAAFIKARIAAALKYRLACGALDHSYRLVHSEADGLPGLIVDVFGDHAVMQIGTYAMEIRRDAVTAALLEILAPKAIIEKSDAPYRAGEGLPERNEIVYGKPRVPCEIRENGAAILADLPGGQKTGYFLDQAKNRALAIPFFRGGRVLDLFCYVGAWSLVAAVNGASETIGVDSSDKALALAEESARINSLEPSKCRFINADVFAHVRQLVDQKEKFDVVILDPPSLAKSKKDVAHALAAYRELNLRAMRLLADDGLLVTCSCSHNVTEEDFRNMLTLAAKDSRTDFSILNRSWQSPDHPVHLQTPETSYLKAFFLKKRAF